MSPERIETEVDGRRLSLSNLEKVLYPEAKFTKGEVLNYYMRVAEVMLPHIRNRPVTMKRFPNGVDGMSFFEKHAPSHMPDWIPTALVPSSSGTHEPIKFALINDRPSLIWAANLACLEFHVPLWRAVGKKLPTPPDYLVFDLDPGPGTTIVDCCQVARWVAERLGQEKVFAKTSGSKGLQLYTRLSHVTSEQASERAHELAQSVEKDQPEKVVSNMRKSLRDNKVLIDWSQNNPSKTTVAAYSLRAQPSPTVSTPVTWDEVDACMKSGDPNDLVFVASEVLERVEKFGDLMLPLVVGNNAQSQPSKKK